MTREISREAGRGAGSRRIPIEEIKRRRKGSGKGKGRTGKRMGEGKKGISLKKGGARNRILPKEGNKKAKERSGRRGRMDQKNKREKDKAED